MGETSLAARGRRPEVKAIRCRLCGGEGHNRRSCRRRDAPVAARPPHLTADEERELSERWRRDGDPQALAAMVRANMGLVVKIANEFRHSGPEMDDLIQEGSTGLLVGARKFRTDGGARLQTYASYWIRAYMMYYVVRTHGPVRVGTTQAQRRVFFGMARARRRLEREGRAVTDEAVAQILGVKAREVAHVAPRLITRDVALDARVTDEEGGARGVGSLFATDAPRVDDELAERQEDRLQRRQIGAALAELDERERWIIQQRFLSSRAETLLVLGESLGLSRERVRQIEAGALAKMRKAIRR